MKLSLMYEIKVKLIEDEILKKLEYFLKKIKILSESWDLIEVKYSNAPDNLTDFIEYKSCQHKQLLNFIYDNNLVVGYHIEIVDFINISYGKRDFKNVEYFLLNLNQYESTISEKYETYNFEKMKLVPLTEDFATLDNTENFITHKDILKKIQFQQYFNGQIKIYFINKSLGEFILKNRFTGFQLKHVYKINTNEVLFYQLKITNVIKVPDITTEIGSLIKVRDYVYPSKGSKLYKFFKKNWDVYIYENDYMVNNFCDFNISYFSYKDRVYKNKKITQTDLIVSKRVLSLFKHHNMKSSETPIYSTDIIDKDMFKIDEEVKELIEKCKTNR